MRVQLRIVAGSLRGRKLTCTFSGKLRPAPQRLREALFNILGDTVPDRPFYDIFAGSGAVGLEAVSRGAQPVTLVERDFRTAEAIEQHAKEFGVADQVTVVRADAYRWADRWPGESGPVNIFIGPPFPDFARCFDALCKLIADLQAKTAPGSILMLQSEAIFPTEHIPAAEEWDIRRYGRNVLMIWINQRGTMNDER